MTDIKDKRTIVHDRIVKLDKYHKKLKIKNAIVLLFESNKIGSVDAVFDLKDAPNECYDLIQGILTADPPRYYVGEEVFNKDQTN